MLKKLGLIATMTAFIASSFAQITLNNTLTPQQIIQDVLVGQGIVTSAEVYNGSPANATNVQGNVLSFTNTDPAFPFVDGALLRSNGGTGNVSDADLTATATDTPTNGVILEFDFIPTGDTLSFSYMFASTEYPTYACSQFNDAFAFFISGPGFAGPYSNGGENIALIPGGNIPVAINTVNSGTPGGSGNAANCAAQDPNWQNNAVFFTTAYSTIPGYDYNGGTVELTANASLTCGLTYHIKLAIANVFDTALDSGVFLKGNSFSSNAVDISIATVQNDTILIEGCTDGNIIFSRPASQTADSLIIYFSTGGDAISGVDYPDVIQGDSVVFLPGQDSIILLLDPIDDGLIEGPELITISAFTVTQCGDTVLTEGYAYILDEPFSDVTALDTTILCANDSVPVWVTTEGGFGPYTYDWFSLPDSLPITNGDSVFLAGIVDGPTDYLVISTDACNFDYVDTATITLAQTLSIDSLEQVATPCGEMLGVAINPFPGGYSGATGTPDFNWSGPGFGNPNDIDGTVFQNLSSGWYYFTIEDDVCNVIDSIFVEQDPPPVASFTATPNSGFAPLDVTFQNNSQGGTNFEWNFGNGQTNATGTPDDQWMTYDNSQEFYYVQLVVTEGLCSDTANGIVQIIPFLPLSYDMPNVFTPNNDDDNAVFLLNPNNAKEIELQIFNRWGNLVFESSGDPAAAQWDGTNKNTGVPCVEGTYFYKFTITGQQDESESNHGFVQLIR